MSYRDWNKEMVCPYNNFKECMYDKCPFFAIDRCKQLHCKRADVETYVSVNKNTTNIQVNSRLI